MKHFMINDELEKIKRDFGAVENRIDPNLAAVFIKSAKRDGAKFASRTSGRPADRNGGGWQNFLNAVENLLKIVCIANGFEVFWR